MSEVEGQHDAGRGWPRTVDMLEDAIAERSVSALEPKLLAISQKHTYVGRRCKVPQWHCSSWCEHELLKMGPSR